MYDEVDILLDMAEDSPSYLFREIYVRLTELIYS